MPGFGAFGLVAAKMLWVASWTEIRWAGFTRCLYNDWSRWNRRNQIQIWSTTVSDYLCTVLLINFSPTKHHFLGPLKNQFDSFFMFFQCYMNISFNHLNLPTPSWWNCTVITCNLSVYYIQVVPGRAGGGSFRRKKNYIAKKEFAYRMFARRPTSAMPESFLCCERAFCRSMVVMSCALKWSVLMS